MKRDKALDIIRKNWPDGRVQLQEALLTLAPELKENEDEKIRKELLDYLMKFIPHHDSDLVRKSKVWIAWLEKQGSQNLANSAKTCKVEPKFKVGDWVDIEHKFKEEFGS